MDMHDCLLEERKLEQITFDGGRVYRDHNGYEYTSVTSFLGSFSKAGIDAWRRSVGEEVANQISGKAARLGTRIHTVKLFFKIVYQNNIRFLWRRS